MTRNERTSARIAAIAGKYLPAIPSRGFICLCRVDGCVDPAHWIKASDMSAVFASVLTQSPPKKNGRVRISKWRTRNPNGLKHPRRRK